ncbi:SusC/RagA family TonB-linked outer membrane protein [Halosquirtibacter xylanolyticus]|uniref:SusC/RagA family TonB-linked outer membrane protein n=1 Tax=Halosquirtibacter xylanolyticus TaxID=3374599 RepID=UPI003748AAEA|nr:SusC/RagA family TonB-linked outer membrane protein [Prolixibacteraceae bacterium]
MKKYILSILLSIICTVTAIAQQVSGVVLDRNGDPMKGVKVSVVSTKSIHTLTDDSGIFILETADPYIEINYADRMVKRVWAKEQNNQIILEENDLLIESQVEAILKRTSTAATSSVTYNELHRNASNNVESLYQGYLTGLYNKNVRGQGSALQIVDGLERTIENVNPEDIESVTVLKDAAALALYGVRGANGAIVVTTKRGAYNSFNIKADYKRGQITAINNPKMLDAAGYATAVNEALYYDNYYGVDPATIPAGVNQMFSRYSQQQIDYYRNGAGDGYDADLYPNVDWVGEGTRNHAVNNVFNMTFDGGGKNIRYYTNINYQNNKEFLNPDYAERSGKYDTQFRDYQLNVRTNLDIDITKSTLVRVDLNGRLVENTAPNLGTYKKNNKDVRYDDSKAYEWLFATPSLAFPVRTTSDQWGGDEIYKRNPIAINSNKGFYQTTMRMFRSNFSVEQDLSVLTKGLKASAGIAYDNTGIYQKTGSQTYAYETNQLILNPASGLLEKQSTVIGENGAFNESVKGLKTQYIRYAIKGNLSWNRAFGQHNINTVLQYRRESNNPTGTYTTRENTVGVVNYNYGNRYFLDMSLNYSGSSKLPKGDKFKLYPSISAGWAPIMDTDKTLGYLKIRGSYGRVGYDNVPRLYMDKQYWVTGTGYSLFGPNAKIGTSGSLKEGTIANPNYTIVDDTKYNVGVDGVLFNNLSFTADAFYTQRRDAYVDSQNIISEVLGVPAPQVNKGSTDYKGLELGLNYQKDGKDFSYYIGATTTYQVSEIIENGEKFPVEPYLTRKGNRVGQHYGLESIGYFNSWEEINDPTTPRQFFSDVRPGDVRYKDQNGDGKVNELDVVKIGQTSTPQIYGGIYFGMEYKGFGVDVMLRYATMFDVHQSNGQIYQPLRGKNNISDWYYTDGNVRWTETTKDQANLPRLSTLNNANNYQKSTQWLEDGSFLNISNVKVYYTLPKNWVKQIKLEELKVYVAGNDLYTFDHIKYKGTKLEERRSLFAGIEIKF